jgi:aerobic-type carbon monoxide dehydrogenase small subunit (CoxS/CutS family)
MAEISFDVNGKPVRLNTNPGRALLWVLRTDLELTGTKYGCGEGHCGSRTVLMDGIAVRSCLVKCKDLQGKSITTIEGLVENGKLHPVQEAFVKHDALQCGYCTPGMILTAVALLKENPKPTREQIVRGMEQNLCRCGAHTRIIDAIQTAAAGMKGASAI